MAEEDGRSSKKIQNTQNIPGTRNGNSHGIGDLCLKADYSMKNKNVLDITI